jgi:hypothetical protein
MSPWRYQTTLFDAAQSQPAARLIVLLAVPGCGWRVRRQVVHMPARPRRCRSYNPLSALTLRIARS